MNTNYVGVATFTVAMMVSKPWNSFCRNQINILRQPHGAIPHNFAKLFRSFNALRSQPTHIRQNT
jgi:hypothetical protein